FRQAGALTGRAATEAAFKSKAPQARVFHLAAQNTLDVQEVWQSRIVLASAARDPQGEEGFRHTYEDWSRDLDAELRVLSTCEKGLGHLKRGEGLMGMGRTFLYAGAPSLVASLWPVADDATAELMDRFYGHLARGADKRQALQQAQRELINGRYTHPFYWA